MKLFSILFSFYIVALSLIPCADKEECKTEQHTTSSAAATGHDHHDSDTCTPFCVCACCGQICSFSYFTYDLVCKVPVSVKTFAVYRPSFVSEPCFNIWQPPKIS